jgi:extradiol dioxygenase family protein
MPIREFFHLIHIVDDFDEAEARYDALLSPHVYLPKHWSDFDKRWASLAVVGPDFVLEVMEPGRAESDKGAPIPKFGRRHGEHLHSFAWYVDAADLLPLARRIHQYGARVVDPYGTLAEGRPGEADTFFTYPKDTFGQLEFHGLRPSGSRLPDPHIRPGWSGARWRDEHPLGIQRMSHLTTVVADLDRAQAFYEGPLEAPAFHAETTGDRRSVFALVGSETVVELAQPTGTGTALARDLAEHGELPHAMTFTVTDLDAVERHAGQVGVRVAGRAGETVTLDPADLFGAVMAFTTRELPNDPRS